MVDVFPEVIELAHLVVCLLSCLYVSIPLVRKHMISIFAPDTVRPNAAHSTMITPIIFFSFSGDYKTTPPLIA